MQNMYIIYIMYISFILSSSLNLSCPECKQFGNTFKWLAILNLLPSITGLSPLALLLVFSILHISHLKKKWLTTSGTSLQLIFLSRNKSLTSLPPPSSHSLLDLWCHLFRLSSYLLNAYYMMVKHSPCSQGIWILMCIKARDMIIKIWCDVLSFKSMNQSIYIHEMKTRDCHQPLLDIDVVVDINTGTIELLTPKNWKLIGKKTIRY